MKSLERTTAGQLGLFAWTAVRNSLSVSRGHPVAAAHSLYTMMQLFVRRRFWPNEVLRLGLLEDARDLDDRFISKSRLVARQSVLNPARYQPLTEDKALFHAYCRGRGIPTPSLLAVYLGNAEGYREEPRLPMIGRDAWIRFFERDAVDEMVIKSAHGVYGEGIVFADRTDPDWSAEALLRKLDRAGAAPFVIEARLHNHPELLASLPKTGLQTARIITFVREDGSVELVHAYFKPIVGENRADNHCNGASGNLLCPVDIERGTLGMPLRLTPRGPVQVPSHPDTGRPLPGLVLPQWHDACRLASAAALEFLPLRSIGWDIAFTPQGPVVVEGNARWDPPKFGRFGENAAMFS